MFKSFNPSKPFQAPALLVAKPLDRIARGNLIQPPTGNSQRELIELNKAAVAIAEAIVKMSNLQILSLRISGVLSDENIQHPLGAADQTIYDFLNEGCANKLAEIVRNMPQLESLELSIPNLNLLAPLFNRLYSLKNLIKLSSTVYRLDGSIIGGNKSFRHTLLQNIKGNRHTLVLALLCWLLKKVDVESGGLFELPNSSSAISKTTNSPYELLEIVAILALLTTSKFNILYDNIPENEPANHLEKPATKDFIRQYLLFYCQSYPQNQ